MRIAVQKTFGCITTVAEDRTRLSGIVTVVNAQPTFNSFTHGAALFLCYEPIDKLILFHERADTGVTTSSSFCI